MIMTSCVDLTASVQFTVVAMNKCSARTTSGTSVLPDSEYGDMDVWFVSCH